MAEPVDVFVSYTQVDLKWAEWIAWVLEDGGFSTVLQTRDFAAGENFMAQMQDASAEATHTLAVLSPDYLQSRYAMEEALAALRQETLLPVRIRELELRGLLGTRAYVDLVGADLGAAQHLLLAALERRGHGGRVDPAEQPEFPGAAPMVPRFPGALPAIWNVPSIRSRNFTGREDELAALRSSRVVALTGLGGVGKSQLAVQYAHRHASDYDLVWWVEAEQPTTLVRDVAALAARLELPEVGLVDELAAAEAARRALEQRGGWLLVFDNAAEPGIVRPWLPQAQTGQIVITSRHAAWSAAAACQPLQPLRTDEAASVLQERSGQQDPHSARAVADELGGLPLALEHAAAYMEVTGTPLAEYLALLATARKDMLAESLDAVVATWELSLRQLDARAPAARDLLTVAAFLAPEGIPRSLLAGREAVPDALAVLRDVLVFNTAIAALTHYSLVVTTGDAFAVHRLVQDVTRDYLSDVDRHTWAESAVRLVDAAFPADVDDLADPERWPGCARLLPHLLASAEHAQETAVAAATAASLLRRAGSYLQHRGDYPAAGLRLAQALALAEGARGPDHAEVAYALDALGYLLANQGDLVGARAHLERALTINERDRDHPAVGRTVNNLGRVLRDQGDLVGARQHLDRALAITERTLGPGDPQMASILNNLGRVLRDRGDLAGAQERHECALAIKQATPALGPEHPSVGGTLDLLGRVLRDQGDLAGAREHLERALAIKEAALGADHPEVGLTCWWLGVVLQRQGDAAGGRARLQQARAAYQRVLRLDEAAYGPEHPIVCRDVNNLGCVLHDQGDLDAARAAYERVLRLDEAAYGPEHPIVCRDVNNLGCVLHDQGDLDAARAAYQQALAILGSALDADQPFTEIVSDNLAAVSGGGQRSRGRGAGHRLDVT